MSAQKNSLLQSFLKSHPLWVTLYLQRTFKNYLNIKKIFCVKETDEFAIYFVVKY